VRLCRTAPPLFVSPKGCDTASHTAAGASGSFDQQGEFACRNCSNWLHSSQVSGLLPSLAPQVPQRGVFIQRRKASRNERRSRGIQEAGKPFMK
jgi:hypothetical protein